MSTKNLKPFDLQAALSGKPVMLRDGTKAFVRCHETELPVDDSECLMGCTQSGCWMSWCESGHYYDPDNTDTEDIIGMYPETRIINGFAVPIPVQESLASHTTYYYPVLHSVDYFNIDEWYDDEMWHERFLERGLIFLCEEDAIANAKAMMGIDPQA